MAVFQLSFDLLMRRVEPARNYDPLFAEIEKMERVTIGETHWIVTTNETGKELRDRLKEFIHVNDTLFVSALDEWWAFADIPKMNRIIGYQNQEPSVSPN